MFNRARSGHSRAKLTALVAAAALTATAVTGLFTSAAQADTSGSPDTNTRAALNPATVSTSTGALPGATLSGAVNLQTVNIHVNGGSGTFFGISAIRLCRTGLNITSSSQLSPTSFGNCIANPLSAGSDAFKSVSAAPTNTSVDTTFVLGTGTESSHPGPGSAITCDATNPCSLWIWQSVDTSVAASGNIFKHYDINFAGAPAAPGATVTSGDTQVTVTPTAPADLGNGALANYTITGDEPAVAGPFTVAPGGNHVFTGLSNFTTYHFHVTATVSGSDGSSATTGTLFTGPAFDTTGAPGPAAPPAPSGVSGDGKVTLSLTAPTGAAPQSYVITSSPAGTTNPQTVAYGGNPTQYVFTGLTNGVVYTFTYHAVYAAGNGGESAASNGITPNAQLLNQTINVIRPVGALVLTQNCGTVASPVAPTFGSGPDPLASQYPYPVDGSGNATANYPTNCNVSLGTAHLITTGAGAGQFFEATGALKQVTIVDTRDGDVGFTVTGQMGTFQGAIPTNHFSGSQLGWTPATTDTASYVDSDGVTYDQTVTAGGVVAPNTPNASGLSHGVTGASAAAGQGLGVATLDALLTLWIPLPNNADTYTGVFQISAI